MQNGRILRGFGLPVRSMRCPNSRNQQQKRRLCLIISLFLRFERYCSALCSTVWDGGRVLFVIQPCIIYEFSFQESSSPWHCNVPFFPMESRLLPPFCPLSILQNKFPTQNCGHELVREQCEKRQTLFMILNETLSAASGVQMGINRWFQARWDFKPPCLFFLPSLSCPLRGGNKSLSNCWSFQGEKSFSARDRQNAGMRHANRLGVGCNL